MRDRYLKYIFLIPGLLVVFFVTVWPITRAFQISFMEWKLSRSNEPLVLWSFSDGWQDFPYLFDNFVNSFQDSLALNALWVSFVFTFFSVFITIVLSMGLALILFKGGFFRSFVRSILLLPFAMSPALVGVSFRFMFHSDFGLFHAFFAAINPALAHVDWLGSELLAMIVLVACDVWHWSPYITLLLIGGLTSVPKEAQEAAFVDGANSFRVFFDITAPIMAPTLGVAIILKAIFSLKMFDQVYMLTNGGPNNSTQTLAHYIYSQGFKYYDMGYASALSYWLVVPLIFLAITYIKLVFSKS
jgi:multiple sugar transport system permease protein